MRKIVIIGVSILSVFILCSLSYQPMVADTPIIESKAEGILTDSEDCECSKIYEIDNPPFLLCSILWLIYFKIHALCRLSVLLIEIFHIDFLNIIYYKFARMTNIIIAYLFDFECIDLTPNYYSID